MMTTASLEGESVVKDATAHVNYDAEAGSQESSISEKEVNAEDLNGFWERQDRRMATASLEGESMPEDATADVNFDAEAANLESESAPKDATASVNCNAEAANLQGESASKDAATDVDCDAEAGSQEPPSQEGSERRRRSKWLWERQARRVARNPCTHLHGSLLLALLLLVIGLVVGELSVPKMESWESGGAPISDHQTQLSLTQINQLKLNSSFDLSSEEARLHLLGFCNDLFDQEFAAKIDTDCSRPLQKFDAWLKEQSNAASPDDICVENFSGASRAPVAQDQFHPCVVLWTHVQ